jgi:hypothetical protein
MIDNNIAAPADHQHRGIGSSSEVGASCPRPVAPDALTSPQANDGPALLEPSLVPPFPLLAPAPLDIPSPLCETQPDLSLNFAATVVPASDVSLPAPPIARTLHSLRLPSFDVLGIAAPHPDRPRLHPNLSFSVGAGPLSKPEDPLHVLSPRICQLDGADRRPRPRPKPAKPNLDRIVPLVTPPTEPGAFHWGNFVKVKTIALGSPPSSDPGQSPNLATVATAPSLASAPIVVPTVIETTGALGMVAWTQKATETLSKCSWRVHQRGVLTFRSN